MERFGEFSVTLHRMLTPKPFNLNVMKRPSRDERRGSFHLTFVLVLEQWYGLTEAQAEAEWQKWVQRPR